MHDAHPSELAGAAGEKKNARRVAWVEHRSTRLSEVKISDIGSLRNQFLRFSQKGSILGHMLLHNII
jgi:hypothetical protein